MTNESAVFAFDEKESRRVEALYLTPDVVMQRRRVLDALRLQRGERVVDLGCGPGLLALDMALQVGETGGVHCIDASADMVALATRRLAPFACAQVQQGDVAALDFADAAFDAAVCTQVYEYVAEIDQALAELHRVLRPGGRALIVDTDWESCVWHSSDSERMRRVLDTWDQHCAHPQLPRTLSARLRRAGLEVQGVDVIAIVNERHDVNTYSFGMIETLSRFCAKRGSADEANAWAADLRALGQRDEYFFSVNRYLFSSHKRA